MRMVEPDEKSRSYATREHLVKEAVKMIPGGVDHLVTWVPYPLPSGRWTAIFFLRPGVTHYALPIASHGYTVIG